MSQTVAQSLIAFFILAVLVLLNAFGILSPVMDYTRLGSEFLMTPLVKILEMARNFGTTVTAIRNLAAQNEILTEQVQKLTAEAALLEKSRSENKLLREALGFQSETNLKLISAEVITFDQFNLDQKAVLNRGSDHGLAVGDSVVVAGAVLVGVLTDVSAKTAEMELITSSATVVNARTAGGGATGIVRGEHGLGLLFDQVSQGERLAAGDRVVTSGLGGKFAGSLLIGIIGEIRSGASELFQTASLIPAANFRDLSIVFIVKK